MQITVRLPTTIEVARVRCVLPYDEEDFEEQELADFPGRDGTPKGGAITLEIDLDTSRVVGWPEGHHASLHMKVVDGGTYMVLDRDGGFGEVVEDYVPGWLPGHFGDYFIADIQGDGAIFQDGKPWEADPNKIVAWLDEVDE